MIGVWQLVLIFAIVLVLFGAGKIPTIMKDLGSGLRAFKRGMEEEEDDAKEIDFTISNVKLRKKKQEKGSKKRKVNSKNVNNINDTIGTEGKQKQAEKNNIKRNKSNVGKSEDVKVLKNKTQIKIGKRNNTKSTDGIKTTKNNKQTKKQVIEE